MKNNEIQKAIFKYIIENDDLSRYKTNYKYFENETISDIFNAIVLYYKEYKTILNNAEVVCSELNNKYSYDIINSVLKFDISNFEKDFLIKETNEYIQEIEVRKTIKETIEKLQSGDKEAIKIIAKNLGVQNNLLEDIEENKNEIKTPLIDSNIYDNLPNLLKCITSHFEDREKDLVLLSSLSVISVLFDNFYMRWSTEKDKPNLLFYVGANAGSGKGKMKYAKKLLNKYIEKENENNKLLKLQNEVNNITEKIPYKNIIIPGNSSSAGFEQKLVFNGGRGLIFSEESSEIGMNKSSGWGDYDYMLRKAFHNETISSNRKDCEIININKSFISCSVSGTYDQLFNMFESKDQNGLFSRFMFYIFQTENYWKRDGGLRNIYNNENDIDKTFYTYSEKVYNIYDYYKNSEIEIDLTDKQVEKFDDYFERLDSEYYSLFGQNIKSSVNRMGVISRKILIILTLIRYYETNINDNDFNLLECFFEDKIMINDNDLDIVLELASTLLQHTALVFNSFFSNGINKEIIMKQDNKLELFKSMNNDFTFAEIRDKAEKEYNIKAKTIQRFLKDLIDKKIIISQQKGHYKKIQPKG